MTEVASVGEWNQVENPTIELILAESRELTKELYEMIKSSDRFDSAGRTVDDILNLSDNGEAQIWVYWKDSVKGVVVTQINLIPTPQGNIREFFIWRVAGQGMLALFEHIDAQLEELARRMGAERLRTYSQNHTYPEMLKRMEDQNWSAFSVEMIKEVQYGR